VKIVCISCDRELDLPELNSLAIWQSKKFICPSCNAEQKVTVGETEWLVDVPGEAGSNGTAGEFFKKIKVKFCATSDPRSSKGTIRFQTEDLPSNQKVITLGFP
jgi:hypothetical protein